LQRERQFQKIFYLEIARMATITSKFPIADGKLLKPRPSISPVEEIAALGVSGEAMSSHVSPLGLPSIRGLKRSFRSFPNIL
jgi:hypothetical protein